MSEINDNSPGCPSATALQEAHIERKILRTPDATTASNGPRMRPDEAQNRLGSTAEPKLWSGTELLITELPEPVWAIPDLLPEGVAVIGGRPKLGKSRLLLSLSIAIATGGCAIGQIMIDVPGDVLYLCLEDGEQLTQERLLQMTADLPPESLSRLTLLFDLRGVEGVKIMDQWIRGVESPRLIVIDTFVKFREGLSSRQDDPYREIYDVLKPFVNLTRERHVALLIATHTRKNNQEDGDWADAILGTIGLTAIADTILGMFQMQNSEVVSLNIRGRRLREEISFALTDDGHAGWKIIGDANDYMLSEQRKAIIDVFKKCDSPLKPATVADTLGTPASKQYRVRQLLGLLVSDGTLIKVGYGKYQLPPSTPSTPSTLQAQMMLPEENTDQYEV